MLGVIFRIGFAGFFFLFVVCFVAMICLPGATLGLFSIVNIGTVHVGHILFALFMTGLVDLIKQISLQSCLLSSGEYLLIALHHSDLRFYDQLYSFLTFNSVCSMS